MEWRRIIEMNTLVNAVRCSYCGKLHDVNAVSFVAFHGNVTIGMYAGIIGNNLGENREVARVEIYCRNKTCLKPYLDKYLWGEEN